MKKLFWILPALAVVACQPEKKEEPKTETPATEQTVTEEPVVDEQMPEEPTIEEPMPEVEAPAAKFDVNHADTLVGQPLETVKPALDAAKIRFRVVEQDGESMIVTMDYSPDRLNFKIKYGVIIEVKKG
jgi:hypothetical protein